MFVEAIEEILKDHCTPAVVRAVEEGESPAGLWAAIADAGFLELLASETEGGAGLKLPELYPVVAMIGRYAVPAPLAQSIGARVLLGRASDIPSGMLTFASGIRRGEGGRVSCPMVPFGAVADYVLVQEEGNLLLLPCVTAHRALAGVHGSLVATLSWEASATTAWGTLEAGTVATFGAALHAALLAGAMQRAFELTLQYANDRSQFGKSIGKFQTIQHQISVMAEHLVASSVAAEAAFQGTGATPDPLMSAMAKSRTSEAAGLVASIAHAVHGAIGVTEEYDLQLFTRRLHEWRGAYGSESYWNQVVGRHVLASSQASLADFVRTASA